MKDDIENYGYNIINGQAYTEDHVVVYNLLVYNIVEWTTEAQVFNYFKQFGDVLKIRLMVDSKRQSKLSFVYFADPKIAAKVLKNNNYRINCCRIDLLPCYSWQQPDADTAESSYLINSVHSKMDTATEEPSLSNSKSMELNGLILNLNDDCLEHIFTHLIRRDQINFARACRRFRDVFITFAKIEYKLFELDNSLTLWQIRELLKMTGLHIESLVGIIPISQTKRIIEFLGTYCTNTKNVYVGYVSMFTDILHKLFGKMSLCSVLAIRNELLFDDTIEVIVKYLPKLQTLILESISRITGKYISELRDLEVLSLHESKYIQSIHFKEICLNLTNLHTLDIRNCSQLHTADFEEITKHLNKLETLKFSCNDSQYECLARLPRLKSLEIMSEDMYRQIRYNFFVELVKYQSKQLEELILVSPSSIYPKVASLIGDLEKLKKLCCASNRQLDDECLIEFAQLNELEEINLKNCRAFTNNGLLILLKNCHKLIRLNIIRCKSLTDAFVYEALKLLQLENKQGQRKGPVLLLANRTNIDKCVADSPELMSLSDLMKITFEIPFFDFYDNVVDFLSCDNSEFDDEEIDDEEIDDYDIMDSSYHDENSDDSL